MHVALGHELIHAERAMRGVTIPLSYRMDYPVTIGRITTMHRAKVEELVTIGILPGDFDIPPSRQSPGRFVPVQTITENSLRAEHGLSARTYW